MITIPFLATIIAFLRKNINRQQVLKYDLIILVLSLVFHLAIALIGVILMRLSVVFMYLIGIVTFGVEIALFALWIYNLVFAIKDRELLLLKKFEINI